MSNDKEGQWYHDDLPRFRDALTFTAAETGFNARLIEKDYFCSLVLLDLSGLFDEGLVFKGGTCLSRIHAEFFRLSEDLDFCVSIRPDATRSKRRDASLPFRTHLTALPARHVLFKLVGEFKGHDDSRQYEGRFAYRSVVTGEDEYIKIDISFREEIVLPSEWLQARTLLRDPLSPNARLAAVRVRVLQREEAYAEKVRAALTRREPAIRDFFDIDHAIRNALFGHRDRAMLALVAAKLAVSRNDPVDLSETKISLLRGQLEGQLRPVSRTTDYEAFDLPRVLAILGELISLQRSD